ncbi:MAG: hypothetical protein AAB434_06145 [Planctomycetota bacterium]
MGIRTIAVLVTMVLLQAVPASGEDRKTRPERTKKSEYYGISAIKPEAAEWEIVQESGFDDYFRGGTSDMELCFVRWPKPNPDKSQAAPEMVFYVIDLSSEFFKEFGGSKGLSKELFKLYLNKYYRDVEDVKEPTRNNTYKSTGGKSVTEFSFTGTSMRLDIVRRVHVMLHKGDDHGYIIVVEGEPEAVKRNKAEEKYILDNMTFAKGSRDK